MAAGNAQFSRHSTTTAGTAETSTINGQYEAVELKNRSSFDIYATAGPKGTVADGRTTTAVVGADNTVYLAPGESWLFPSYPIGTDVSIISSSGAAYSTTGVVEESS